MMSNTIQKIQKAASLLNEAITETEAVQWNIGVMVVYLLHHQGSVEVPRIPRVNDTHITLKQIMDLVATKKIVVALEFDKLKLFKYSTQELTPLESFEALYELIAENKLL